MTERGKCETCQNWNVMPRTSSKPMCHVLERELIGRADYRMDMKIPVLQPPADFGCIYHEPKPEKVCGNCRKWCNIKDSVTLNGSPDFHICAAKSDHTGFCWTIKENGCNQWEPKP